jgi:hypothetical protein
LQISLLFFFFSFPFSSFSSLFFLLRLYFAACRRQLIFFPAQPGLCMVSRIGRRLSGAGRFSTEMSIVISRRPCCAYATPMCVLSIAQYDPHRNHIIPFVSTAQSCIAMYLELGKWSKMAVLRVLFDTSEHFVRSTESGYVYLLPSHVAHAHDVISCLGPSSICVGVLQGPDMWSKMAVLRVLFDTSEHFVRSTESGYVYLLPTHIRHVHDIAPCCCP